MMLHPEATVTPDSWEWRAQSAPQEMSIDLVRADVTVVRSSGLPQVQAWDPGVVVLQVREAGGQVQIEDRYPPRLPGMWLECLPPPTDRGDIWSYTTRLQVRVEIAPGQRLRVHVQSGKIHTQGADPAWSLRADDGKVDRLGGPHD